ncbi:hypothetical protein GCM10022223_12710 [Kineosporia mesophila]|uniref:PilZ domain-containing protein n=1 Tax=Kineosporia mesophila TaxID=566012 RepID=A0ABP6Z7D3_9ACTN|nr:PilZ domain-containing protein [Kineosporia mesophila]
MKLVPWPRKNDRTSAGRTGRSPVEAPTQRRRFVREMVRVPLVVLDSHGIRLATGATIEVSEGGVRAHLNQHLHENTRVRVELHLARDRIVAIGGTVRRAPGDRRPIVVAFDHRHAHQDDLRALVFAAQRANAKR